MSNKANNKKVRYDIVDRHGRIWSIICSESRSEEEVTLYPTSEVTQRAKGKLICVKRFA